MDKAGRILKQFLNDTNLESGRMYSSFFKSWVYFVGQKLYGHTKIIDIEKNVLYVEVDHPGWLQLIRLQEKSILEKIKKKHPSLQIKYLKYKVKFKSAEDMIPEKKEEPLKDEVPLCDKDLEGIQNQELRGLLNKLYKSVLNKEK